MYGYVEDVAPDHVIFSKDGKTYRLDYSGDAYSPKFSPLSEAVEVESKRAYVPKKEVKKNARKLANEKLRKMGLAELDADEDVPARLAGKKSNPNNKEKGAYST